MSKKRNNPQPQTPIERLAARGAAFTLTHNGRGIWGIRLVDHMSASEAILATTLAEVVAWAEQYLDEKEAK